jgi:anti-sigma factor RsiW
MRDIGRHPANLVPFLDGDLADPGYEKIRLHLDECEECRRECEAWRQAEKLVRAHAPRIEVPPFEWRRIAARLDEKKSGAGWFARFAGSVRAHRLAWNAALGTLLIAAITASGLEFRRHARDQVLVPIMAYAASETARLGSAGNPFQAYVDAASDENPFAKFTGGIGRTVDQKPNR